MRSEQVFSVTDVYANRFLICQVASKTARMLHQPATPFCSAITRALGQMAEPGNQQDQSDRPKE